MTLRSLPRAFVDGIAEPAPQRLPIPDQEYKKFHSVLRLGKGDSVGILPGDGRLLVCRLDGHEAVVEDVHRPQTEAPVKLTLALALAKPEALEEAVRMATEIGAYAFVLFPSDRSVVRWEPKKLEAKLERLRKIAREAAETAFRTRLPAIGSVPGLDDVLRRHAEAFVLSEWEDVTQPLRPLAGDATLVFGPEGGWSPRESERLKERALTMGPRVMRVDTAVAAACAIALASR